MPEGDTLFRIAERVRPALLDKVVEKLELPRRDGGTSRVNGATIVGVEAHGKNLFVRFSTRIALHVHLKMLGAARVMNHEQAARVFLGDISARLWVPESVMVVTRAPIARLVPLAEIERVAQSLGPDPLREGFSVEDVVIRLRARETTPIGVAIMDQGAIAGVGNVFKSEVLFATALDPFAPVQAFTDDELRHLVKHTEIVMSTNARVPSRKPMGMGSHYAYTRRTRDPRALGSLPYSVYMRSGRACLQCGTRVEMKKQGEQQRMTYYCPMCQPRRANPWLTCAGWLLGPVPAARSPRFRSPCVRGSKKRSASRRSRRPKRGRVSPRANPRW